MTGKDDPLTGKDAPVTERDSAAKDGMAHRSALPALKASKTLGAADMPAPAQSPSQA